MRLIVGAAAVAQGVLIALAITVGALVKQDSAARWMGVVIAAELAIIAIGLHLVWHARNTRWKRWRVAAGAMVGGILGIVLMGVTTTINALPRGNAEIDGRLVPTYELNVTFLDYVLYREMGQGIFRGGSIGPDDDLTNTMLAIAWSMTAIFAVNFSFLGAGLAFGIRRLSNRET